MTIHWKALVVHFLMVPLVDSGVNNFLTFSKIHFSQKNLNPELVPQIHVPFLMAKPILTYYVTNIAFLSKVKYRTSQISSLI
jgi:hypothetical protein